MSATDSLIAILQPTTPARPMSSSPTPNNTPAMLVTPPRHNTLGGHDQRRDEDEDGGKCVPTPLPKAQLAALCSTRIVDPVAFSQIFPYVNVFMKELGVAREDPSQIGFYSGMVLSAFAFAQMFSIYPWARLSDKIGRRPVVLVGVLGVALATLACGLSTTFVQVLVSRCIAGLFSGNVAVIVSVLGEITDPSNAPVAYPIYGLFWPLGVIVGPLLGGTLAHAGTKYPTVFSHAIFREHPYVVPCAVAAAIGLFSAVFAFFCLGESMPSKSTPASPQKKKGGSYGTFEDGEQEVKEDDEDDTSVRALLAHRGVRTLALSGGALSFVATAFDAVFVLFCYTPVASGGLGFPAAPIGYALAGAGGLSALMQVLFLPRALRTFDHARMYDFFVACWAPSFALLPLLTCLTSLPRVALWAALAVVLVVSRVGCLAYSLSMILVKENVPSARALAASNGLVQFTMCFSRAFAPFFVSSCFALSIDYDLLGGHLWVAVMVLLSLLACTLSVAGRPTRALAEDRV